MINDLLVIFNMDELFFFSFPCKPIAGSRFPGIPSWVEANTILGEISMANIDELGRTSCVKCDTPRFCSGLDRLKSVGICNPRFYPLSFMIVKDAIHLTCI